MKKLTAALLIGVTALLAQGCGKKKEAGVPVIGIAKVTSHPSLDATEKGITDFLAEKGIKAAYDFQNANGDINTAASIAAKFKADGADITVGIGTPVAVALASAYSDKPVIFSAITDPVSAHLVETAERGYKNVTGAVDTIPIREQIKEFRKVYPFKKLGFIYTSSESNSVSMAATAKKTCEELGIEFIPATITNSSEIKQAAESLAGRVDAFYVVTDNALVAGINSLMATAAANKIPVFSGDIMSSLDGGALYVLGFDYYSLGRATGEIIMEVLSGKSPAEIPVYALTNPEDYKMLLDLDAAKRLGINIPDELKAKADYIYENGSLREREKSAE